MRGTQAYIRLFLNYFCQFQPNKQTDKPNSLDICSFDPCGRVQSMPTGWDAKALRCTWCMTNATLRARYPVRHDGGTSCGLPTGTCASTGISLSILICANRAFPLHDTSSVKKRQREREVALSQSLFQVPPPTK